MRLMPDKLITTLMAVYLATTSPILALITGAFGNDPVQDMGWPAGSLAVANDTERLGYWEGPPFGGGEYHFLFGLTSSQSLERLLKAFSDILAPGKEIILRDEPLSSFWLSSQGKESISMNAECILWKPENWNWLHNNPQNLYMSDSPGFRSSCPPPRLILSTTAFPAFQWMDLPDACTIIDQRWGPDPTAKVFHVQVLDMSDHKPVSNARIIARKYPRDSTSDLVFRSGPDGLTRITGLSRGSYRILVTADSYAEHKIDLFPKYQDLDDTVIVYLSKSASLSGIVKNSGDQPVPGAQVRLVGLVGMDGQPYPQPESPTCETDEQGAFRLEGLPHGYAQVIALHQDYKQLEGMEDIVPIPGKSMVLVLVEKDRDASAGPIE